VKVTVKKIDSANVLISGTLDSKVIEENVDKLAKQAGKEMKVDGFRKGKVPAHVVKKLHGDKLVQDAEGEVLRELIDAGTNEAKINTADMIGQPVFKKYDKTDKGIEVEVEISIRPKFDLDGYMDVVPTYEKPEVDQEEVTKKLEEMAKEQAPYVKIKRKRMVQDGDMVLIDFEGFVDGVAFDGGKAEGFNLKIGSSQFIAGFEEQIIGMKYEEEKEAVVTFPKDYQHADLAGKEATFKVTLNEIQEQAEAEINDVLAQKLLNDEKATLKALTEKVEAQIETAALSKVYNEELKPKLIEALVKKFDFALPNNIIEQEIDVKVNTKAQAFSEEELAKVRDNEEEINKLRDSVKEEAIASVKATFIVDALAKKEEINVEDQEVSQAIYYEAMVSGQDPQKVISHYQDNNLLPAVKMGMIEDKLFGKMLGFEK